MVVGYHGCRMEVADMLLSGTPFVSSTNMYDWLGDGAYLWEYGPHRASEWAEVMCKPDWAVVQATINLGHCLNLVDIGQFNASAEA